MGVETAVKELRKAQDEANKIRQELKVAIGRVDRILSNLGTLDTILYCIGEEGDNDFA